MWTAYKFIEIISENWIAFEVICPLYIVHAKIKGNVLPLNWAHLFDNRINELQMQKRIHIQKHGQRERGRDVCTRFQFD